MEARLRSIATAIAVWLTGWAIASGQTVVRPINPGVPWPATDGLGRVVPITGGPIPRGPRPDRYVGIFYFLWHDNPGGKRPEGDGPYDVSKILKRDPQALSHPQSPLWGPQGMYHYWAEPLYGYYQSTDPWVIRRHGQLLAAAGIDTLIFDTTNAVTYPNVYRKICEVFTEMRRAGSVTPSIAFMLNSSAGATARSLYKDLYEPGLYRDLWFMWRGKPLMLCDPADAPAEVRAFFTLRRAHWPFTLVNTQNAWHWEATYPQPYGYTDDPGRAEQVNVSVAQNLRVGDGLVTNMSAGNARGRSFHDEARDRSPGAVARGQNFQEQWKRALALDPPFVMVTGWNEWIAGRWGKPDGPIEFVDQFDQEFSRDIEPMKGGHGDHYYYELVANVRRYKGAAPLPSASHRKSIAIDGGFDQWRDVKPVFTDEAGDTLARDHDGAGGTHYVARAGPNDLVAFKVANDETNLYFYVRSGQPFADITSASGLELLIDADQKPGTGWEGFDHAVDWAGSDGRTAALKHSEWSGTWKQDLGIRYRQSANELHLEVPKSALNVPAGSHDLSIDFKWIDHVRRSGDIMDFYLSGDVAPEGRFRFRYTSRADVANQ